MSEESRDRRDFLKSLENERGFAYLVGIFSIFGPTTIELLVRDRALFLALEWQKILLLGASVGGSLYVLAVIASLMIHSLLASRGDVSSDGEQTATITMILGGLFSLAMQAFVMLSTAHSSFEKLIGAFRSKPDSFVGYVAALTGTAIVLGAVAAYGFFRMSLGDRAFRRRLGRSFLKEFPFSFIHRMVKRVRGSSTQPPSVG